MLEARFLGTELRVKQGADGLEVTEGPPDATVETPGGGGLFEGTSVQPGAVYDAKYPFHSVRNKVEGWQAQRISRPLNFYSYTPIMLIGDGVEEGLQLNKDWGSVSAEHVKHLNIDADADKMKFLSWDQHATSFVSALGPDKDINTWVNTGLGVSNDDFRYKDHVIKMWQVKYIGTALPKLSRAAGQRTDKPGFLKEVWENLLGNNVLPVFEGNLHYPSYHSFLFACVFGRVNPAGELRNEPGKPLWHAIMAKAGLNAEQNEEMQEQVVAKWLGLIMPRVFMQDVLGKQAMDLMADEVWTRANIMQSLVSLCEEKPCATHKLFKENGQPKESANALQVLQTQLCRMVAENQQPWNFEDVKGGKWHWVPSTQNAGTCALHCTWWGHWVARLNKVVWKVLSTRKEGSEAAEALLRAQLEIVRQEYVEIVHHNVCLFLDEAWSGNLQYRLLLQSIMRQRMMRATPFWHELKDPASALWVLIAAERPEGNPLFLDLQRTSPKLRGTRHNNRLPHNLVSMVNKKLEDGITLALNTLAASIPSRDDVGNKVIRWKKRMENNFTENMKGERIANPLVLFQKSTAKHVLPLLLQHIIYVVMGPLNNKILPNINHIPDLPPFIRRILARILVENTDLKFPAMQQSEKLQNTGFEWLALDMLGCTAPYMLTKNWSGYTRWEKQLQTHLPVVASLPRRLTGWEGAMELTQRTVGYELADIPLTIHEVNYAVLSWIRSAFDLKETKGAWDFSFANDGAGNRPVTVAISALFTPRSASAFEEIDLGNGKEKVAKAPMYTYHTTSVILKPAALQSVDPYPFAEALEKKPYPFSARYVSTPGIVSMDCNESFPKPSVRQILAWKDATKDGLLRQHLFDSYSESVAETDRLFVLRRVYEHKRLTLVRMQAFDAFLQRSDLDVLLVYRSDLYLSQKSIASKSPEIVFVNGDPLLDARRTLQVDFVEWPPFQPDFYPGLAWLPVTDCTFGTLKNATVTVWLGMVTPNRSSCYEALVPDVESPEKSVKDLTQVLTAWAQQEAGEQEAEEAGTRDWDPSRLQGSTPSLYVLKVNLNTNLCFPVMPSRRKDRELLKKLRSDLSSVILPQPSGAKTSAKAYPLIPKQESNIQDLMWTGIEESFLTERFVMPQNDFGLLPCDEFLNAHNPEQFAKTRKMMAEAVVTEVDEAMLRGIELEMRAGVPVSEKDLQRLRYSSIRTRWSKAFMSRDPGLQDLVFTAASAELAEEIQKCHEQMASFSPLARMRATGTDRYMGVSGFADWARSAYGPVMRLGKCLTTLAQVNKLKKQMLNGGIKDPYSAMNLQRGAMDEGYRTRFEGLKMRSAAELLFEVVFGHNVTTVQWDLVDAMQSREEKEGRVWQLMMGQGKTSVITPLVAFQQWLEKAVKTRHVPPAHVFCPDHLVDATLQGMDMIKYMVPHFCAQVFSNKAAQLVSVVPHSVPWRHSNHASENMAVTVGNVASMGRSMSWNKLDHCVLLIDELHECMSPSSSDFNLVQSKQQWLSSGELMLMLACVLHTHTDSSVSGAEDHFNARWAEIVEAIEAIMVAADKDPENEMVRQVMWDGKVVLRWSQPFKEFLKKLLGMSQHMQYRVHYGPRSAELRQTMLKGALSRAVVPYMRSDTPMDDSEFSTPALNILLWAVRFCNYDTQLRETTEFALGGMDEVSQTVSPVSQLPEDITQGLSRNQNLRVFFLNALEQALTTLPGATAVPTPSWFAVWRDPNETHQGRMEAIRKEMVPLGATPTMLSLQRAALLTALLQTTDAQSNLATEEVVHTHMWGTLLHWATSRDSQDTLQVGYSGTLEVVDAQMLQKVQAYFQSRDVVEERDLQDLQCLPQVMKRNAVANILPKLSLTGQLDGVRPPMFLAKAVAAEYGPSDRGSGDSASSHISTGSQYVCNSFDLIVETMAVHKYDALIDSTAFLKDYAPKDVARAICAATKRATLFLDSKDITNMWVWVDGTPKLRKNTPPVHVPGCIMYFDQRHTVGTDIARQPGRLHGLLLLGHKTTVAQASQAAARLRKIAQGHLVDLCWTSIAMPSSKNARGIWNSLEANERRAVTGSAQLTSYVHQLQLSLMVNNRKDASVRPLRVDDMEHSSIWMPKHFHRMQNRFEKVLFEWFVFSRGQSSESDSGSDDAVPAFKSWFMEQVKSLSQDPSYELDNFVMFITGLSVCGDGKPSTRVNVNVSMEKRTQAQHIAKTNNLDRTPRLKKRMQDYVMFPPPPERAFDYFREGGLRLHEGSMVAARARMYNGMYRIVLWTPDVQSEMEWHPRFAVPLNNNTFAVLHNPKSVMYFMSLGCVNVLQGGRAHGQSMVFDSSWRKGHNINMQPLMPLISMGTVDYGTLASASEQLMRSTVHPFVDATFFEASCPSNGDADVEKKEILQWMKKCDGDDFYHASEYYKKHLCPAIYCSIWSKKNTMPYTRASDIAQVETQLWQHAYEAWKWDVKDSDRFETLVTLVQPPLVTSGPAKKAWEQTDQRSYVQAVWGTTKTGDSFIPSYPPSHILEEDVHSNLQLTHDSGRARLFHGRFSTPIPEAARSVFSGAKYWQKQILFASSKKKKQKKTYVPNLVKKIQKRGVCVTKEGQLALDPEACPDPVALLEAAKSLESLYNHLDAEMFWSVGGEVLEVDDCIPSYRRARYWELMDNKLKAQSTPSLSCMEGIPALNTSCSGVDQAKWTRQQATLPAYFVTEGTWDVGASRVPFILLWRRAASISSTGLSEEQEQFLQGCLYVKSEHMTLGEVMKSNELFQRRCTLEPPGTWFSVEVMPTPKELNAMGADRWGEATMMWLAAQHMIEMSDVLLDPACDAIKAFQSKLLATCAGFGTDDGPDPAAWMPWLQAYYEHTLRKVA